MAIRLEKGQRINLEKNGSQLKTFCVGCNWGAIPVKTKAFMGLFSRTENRDVDLDLSCLVADENGEIIDYIYSPEYRESFLASYGLPKGKLDSFDGALHHSGDDRAGDKDGDDGLDNEIIVVDLSRISPRAAQIFFFLNNVGPEDFSQIPYASIRMYEGTPHEVRESFAQYDVAAEGAYRNRRALIMGCLYKKNKQWKFNAIGDATNDAHICDSIARIKRDYIRRLDA